MGAVKILDFKVDQKESFKQMLHNELDRWINGIEDVLDTNKQPTVMELSELFTETRQKFLGNCMQLLIENKYSEQLHQEFCNCPKCGALCKKRRDDQKQIITMQGPSVITRPWFYCTHCFCGFHPIDQILEISRKEYQFDVQKQSVKLSSKLPFADASETFTDLTGLSVSDHFIHNTYEDVGSEARIEDVIPSRDEMVHRIKEATAGNWRPILVVASDGAHLPTREKAKRNERRGKGKWKEAKGFRIYLLSHERIIHMASWHQIQGEEEFGKDLAFVASRIPQDMVRISLLGDGADWLWKHMTAQFPKGRAILDYYHCSEHIHKVGKVQYGEKSEECLEWIESTMSRLYFGEVSNVISGLKRIKPRNGEAKEEIRKLCVYLNNNRERIHYKGDRKGGYSIGSGGIESANKFICHTRMKRSGAWWVIKTGNGMLRIRCAIYNGTYNVVFDRYKNVKLGII